jgi:hypothetical protein
MLSFTSTELSATQYDVGSPVVTTFGTEPQTPPPQPK